LRGLFSSLLSMQVKKGLVNALTIIAFPLQLVSCAYFINRTSPGFAVLFIVSIIAHILYYLRVIKEGKNQYKSHFLYYEIGVAIIQSFLALDHLSYFIGSVRFWMMYVPAAFQVLTCILMYFHHHQCQSDELPFYINDRDDGPGEFPAFPIVPKSDMI
ncbi:hypothetical protein PENTCL1PPCAC_22261, partial [Pristionchus entomophagus]